MWHRRSKRSEAEIVDDCAAFLQGHYVARLEERWERVPPWAWTNLLAHGTEAELRVVAAGPVRTPRSAGQSWRAAQVFLSREVLAAARRLGSLRAVQGEALIPLELQLAAEDERSEWMSPTDWVTAVRAALEAEHPSPGS
jgi:hypothetical protein